MKRQDFYFNLPNELIAHYPLKSRSSSRLLVYNPASNSPIHGHFKDLVNFLNAGDLIVMNNSKVIPARFYGVKATGGKVEFLLERIINETDFLSLIKSSKSIKLGTIITLNSTWEVTILEKKEDYYLCRVNGKLATMLQEVGHIPLPPYIARADEGMDRERYQTIYAQPEGSVAAPTAGLHFDEEIFSGLQKKGINYSFLTLHVGSGTFRPVRTDNILDHKMHFERFQIPEELPDLITKTKATGNRVIAVGTTTLRALESSYSNGTLLAGERETNIFIYPGYKFQVCDGLITNFHLPESTLLMLVSAFIGYQETMNLYDVAIKENYRFFSYGDASLLLRNTCS